MLEQVGKKWVTITALLCIFLLWHSYRFYALGGLIAIHENFIRRIDGGDVLPILHPGIYWLSILLSIFTALPVGYALHVMLTLHVVLALCALLWALKLLDEDPIDPYLWLLCAAALMVASPIGLPGLDVSVYNFAAYNRTGFLLRNATQIAVMPYMFAAFGLLGHSLQMRVKGNPSAKTDIAGAICLLLSALIKPSFAVAAIPAFGLYAFCSRELSQKCRATFLALLIPAVLLVLAQFYIGFIHNPLSDKVIHIEFRPWVVWVRNNQYPLVSLLLAVVFPLWVLIYRHGRLSAPAIIAWIALFISIVPYALFDEVKGISTSSDRDFEWSYLQARQVLFLCTVIEWWKWLREEPLSPRLRPVTIAGLLFIAHALFGTARLLMVDVAR